MSFVDVKLYGTIVIGGGHAGCEAVLASARRGMPTLLITHNIDHIAAMSCNPAIGGLGKGHMVREIDALGGEMGINADETGIQFRRLNSNKGSAVQGTRCQSDKYLYKSRMSYVLQRQDNVFIKQGVVKNVIVIASEVRGIELTTGEVFHARSVILTTGTFLQGLCHIGMKNFQGGRAGDAPANDLSRSLIDDCGLELMRLKTGTVPRLDGRTIVFSDLEEQFGDDPIPRFSYRPVSSRARQVSCHITYTNERTHDIIRGNLHKSPLFSGAIKGTGPRYCPSIEDKITRFADKDRHQIFLEPEGLTTTEYYPNGLSTSLPYEVQVDYIRSINGLQNAEITRPGYAVEYDAVNPIQIKANYETKNVRGLFLAGQINGTTGYEEAAGQGMLAGINAGQRYFELPEFLLTRDQAYLGVMTDDLITKGVGGEPYRMFTSRAEHRLILREDNADLRLTEFGYNLGLVSREQLEAFQRRRDTIQHVITQSEKTNLKPDHVLLMKLCDLMKAPYPDQPQKLLQLMRRPEFCQSSMRVALEFLDVELNPNDEIETKILSEVKYAGYIQRHSSSIEKVKHYSSIKIPESFEVNSVPSLSNEVKEKLKKFRPQNLSEASKIPGITPAALSIIEVYLSKNYL